MRSAANKRLAMALAGAAAVVLAGTQLAGAQDAEPTVPAPLELCSLITKADAEAALGHSVHTGDSGSGCTYTVIAPGAFASLTVALGPEQVTAENLASGMGIYARAANAELRHVAATGDEAWATLGKDVSQVIAVQEQRSLTIVLIGVTTPADERASTLTGLARTALNRIE